jgi:His/Glu/Gln/Arg/opine family amino acid ABC transporter permease subunit
MSFDLGLLLDSLPRLLAGLWVTVQLVTLSLLFGGALALPLALARTSWNPLLRWPAHGYIFFFRATPLLIQLFLVYYGSGQFRALFEAIGLWSVLREAWWCALIAFTLNTAAYQAEILRGGVQAVPAGEIEAGRALGMSRALLLRRIVLPGAYRISIPALGNEAILMLKASALASVITVFDLMGATRAIFARHFALEMFVYAAVLYLALTLLIGRGAAALEAWLNPQRARQA